MNKTDKFKYKSYCWCLGTTSFRTKHFNKKIEEQLTLLESFWSLPEYKNQNWTNNNILQENYYIHLHKNNFLFGDAKRKDKDAREKTSGLVDLGLLDNERKITSVGKELLSIYKTNNFESNNFLHIPKDCFIYLKQILKTSINIDNDIVRPFIVLLYLLDELEYLSKEEFTFLLPLCTNQNNTQYIKGKIKEIRNNKETIDNVIISLLMQKQNYKDALNFFLKNQATENIICTIGLNRKSKKYDKPYFMLYKNLYSVFFENNLDNTSKLFKTIKKLSIKHLWNKYLFDTSNEKAIENNPSEHIIPNVFQNISDEQDFKTAFFKTMHLLKAKATLSDYYDLNCRYLKTTNVLLFNDSKIRLDVIPKHFFSDAINNLFLDAFSTHNLLYKNCSLIEISVSLEYNEKNIIKKINKELNKPITDIKQIDALIEDERYQRFIKLIEDKFSDKNLISLLDKFSKREDSYINNFITDNADIPTIFEYVLGIIWYKVSNYEGKILDFMKLSLDADLLPISHAIGGEADIVYEYNQTKNYPKHSLLIEATLSDKANQRRMEMEPVSRHLGNHLLKTRNHNSYCIFATNHLNVNVISDFRGRKESYYFNSQNIDDFIEGMKIIPLEISDLQHIIINKKKYNELYTRFESAFISQESNPQKWYENFVKLK